MEHHGALMVMPAVVYSVVALLGATGREKSSSKAISLFVACESVFVAFFGLWLLLEGKTLVATLGSREEGILGQLMALKIGVDPLSAFFLFILGLVGALASVYLFSYIDAYEHFSPKTFNICYPLLIASIYMVFVVRNLLWFIIFWETMTLTSQFLVAVTRKEKAASAALKYFATTKIGADVLLLGFVFAILKASGFNADFSAIRDTLSSLFAESGFAFWGLTVAAAVGFGAKAGLVPLHLWVPHAYDETPSGIAALFSGAMEKVPIYALFRFLLFIFPVSKSAGMLLALLGTASVVVGSLYALVQERAKRLLALCSVEQIGIIVFALGAGIYLAAGSYRPLGLALIFASLFHALNHAILKSLMFMTAGSVFYSTGRTDMGEIRGLLGALPTTAFAAGVGALGLSGIPPTNGFVSKWMVYVSTLPVKGIISLLGGLVFFAGAVTVGMFVKFYSALFVAPSDRPAEARKTRASMWVPELILALTALLFGACPWIPLGLVEKALSPLEGALGASAEIRSFPFVAVPTKAQVGPFFLLLVVFALTAVAVSLFRKAEEAAPVWGCGTEGEDRELKAPSLFAPFRDEFARFYRACARLYRTFAEAPTTLLGRAERGYERASVDLSLMLLGSALAFGLLVPLMTLFAK